MACGAERAWASALALLLLNDHVLKCSGFLPGAVTGKLSDLAGLVVAPVLAAVLAALLVGPGCGVRRPPLISFGIVAGFGDLGAAD
jgi:hypothetical protein